MFRTMRTRDPAAPLWSGRPAFRVNDRYIRWPGAGAGLPNIQPGDGPADEHPLNFARALKNREDLGGHGKSHRHTRVGLPIALCMGAPLPFFLYWLHERDA
jgi:hypothetical protein